MADVVVSRAKLASRWVLFIAVLSVSSWRLLELTWQATRRGSPYLAFLLGPVTAVFLVGWRQRRAERELAIHDRAIDFTLALMVIAVSVGLNVLLSRRLGTFASALAPDVLSVPLWAAAASVALFGTRATIRHLYSLMVLGAVWAPPLFAVAGLVPAQTFGWFVAATIVTVACGGVLTGHGRLRWSRIACRRALCVGVGFVVETVLCRHPITAPVAVIAGPLAVLATAVVTRTAIMGLPPMGFFAGRKRLTPGVARVRRAVPLVLGIAFAGAVVPSLTTAALADGLVAPGQRLRVGPGCPDLGGRWALVGNLRLGDPRRLGALPTTRCRYRDAAVAPAATVAVDFSDPVRVEVLAGFPYEAVYRTIGTESPMQYTERLPGPMIGSVVSFADPMLPLTTVVVTGNVAGRSTRRGFARRLDVMVTDDPRPGSPLPEISPHLASAIAAKLSEITRISPDQARRSTEYPKYAALATELTRVVLRQWATP